MAIKASISHDSRSAPHTAVDRLVRFYKACIEEEDRRSLTLPLGQLGQSFIAPWTGPEALLSTGAGSCVLQPTQQRVRDFLAKGLMAATGADTTYYAYPAFLDAQGYLAPLFFTEVQIVSHDEGPEATRVSVSRVSRGEIKVNHHLFRRQGFSEEELLVIQEELEGDFATFAARLQAALNYLDAPAFAQGAEATEPLGRRTQGPRWILQPILFRSRYGAAFTYNLRYELGALARYNFLQRDAQTTALGTLLGIQKGAAAKGHPLAEVLPLNQAQQYAAQVALQRPLSVITGPPGTGKSQVVVDLLATAILSGQAVLFASKNNKAVDVVRERLRALLGEDGDFTLRLGRKDHMEAMEGELIDRLDRLAQVTLPDPAALQSTLADLRKQREALEAARITLQEAYQAEQTAADTVPESWRTATPADISWDYPLSDLRTHLDRARALSGETRLGFWLWLKRLFRGSALRRSFIDHLETIMETLPAAVGVEVEIEVMMEEGYPPIIRTYQHLLWYHQWLRLREAREEAAGRLKSLIAPATSYEQKLRLLAEARAEAYQALCRATWGRQMQSNRVRVKSEVRDYFAAAHNMRQNRSGAAFKELLTRFASAQQRLAQSLPIWNVVNLSVRNALPLQANLFDLVIIDEASQCDVASALPLLFRARRAVIIGDPMQLSHISGLTEKEEQGVARETQNADLLGHWSYRTHSLYDVAIAAIERKRIEPTFLDAHYRSHPAIIGFSNRAFYGQRLRILTDVERLQERVGDVPLGVHWHVVQGRVPETRRSAFNPAELEAVVRLVGAMRETVLAGPDITLGIVTPFRAQGDRLKARLQAQPWFKDMQPRLTVGTAHAFQGDECDIMLFSPVVAQGMRPGTRRWVAETRPLLNVAVTRARAVLHVVGDPRACHEAGGYLRAFVDATYDAALPDDASNVPKPLNI